MVNNPGIKFGSIGTLAHQAAAAGPLVLQSIMATNANTSKRYLQIFDQLADLAGSEVPTHCFEIPPGSASASAQLFLDKSFLGGGTGLALLTGLVWGISTTQATYTAATAADHIVEGYYNS